MQTGELEDMAEPHEVTAQVSLRVIEGVADAGLRCQVNDPRDILSITDPPEGLVISDIYGRKPKAVVAFTEGRRGSIDPKLSQTSELERGVVIGIEVIEPDDLMTRLK